MACLQILTSQYIMCCRQGYVEVIDVFVDGGI